ncbi:MAG: hypothetical protein QOD74_171 [Variibacter sp.]|jgi:hypothetical protein|nr:hypothetical protein [Variibacter sp.]
MHLIEILLPLTDNAGTPFGPELFAQIRRELTERFGGLTAFSRAPAQGLWKDERETKHDDIVVFEVMADTLDTEWWRDYRQSLERRFRQDAIVARAVAVTRL